MGNEYLYVSVHLSVVAYIADISPVAPSLNTWFIVLADGTRVWVLFEFGIVVQKSSPSIPEHVVHVPHSLSFP